MKLWIGKRACVQICALISAGMSVVSITFAADQTPAPTADEVSRQATNEQAAALEKAKTRALNRDINTIAAQYRNGRYTLAESMARDLLKQYPTNLEAHYLMGNIYVKLNDPTAAEQQYNYCVQTGQKTPVAKLAASALAGLHAELQKLSETESQGTVDPSQSKTRPDQIKPIGRDSLKHADSILQKAQESLEFKKRQLDILVSHAEDFARSRIGEIPLNTIHRRMSAFANIEASRDNENYYTAPNYDRPGEVARIRSTETAKVHGYIDDFNTQQNIIVTNALKEVDRLLGNIPDSIGKPSSSEITKRKATAEKAQAPVNIINTLTACGVTSQRENDRYRVIMVATGSPAHRSGLTPNDLIEQWTFIPDADSIKLTIKRAGKVYALKMQPTPSAEASAAAARPTVGSTNAGAVTPKPTTSQIAWNRIKDSEIVFIEDMSANMKQPLGDTGLSRWDWAAGRLADFADSLSKGTNMGFTLIQCYQYVYEIYRDQSAAGLRQRFSTAKAIEAADLTTPLENIANEYFDVHSQKPLLIMIFTDGHPEHGASIEAGIKTILERAKNQDQVRLVFFQIGDDQAGSAMLRMLDDDLTYAGYKFDIVDNVKFEDLQDSGVSRALLDAYQRPRAEGKTIPPPISQALTDRLAQVRKLISAAH